MAHHGPMRFLSALLVAFAVPAAFAQSTGCDTPESRQLDFWVGEWELAHVQQGKVVTSRNRITKILDGCAVLEEFIGGPETKLDGRSLSLFDRATKQWRQVWVDNTGAWLDFTATTVEGDFAFARTTQRGGKTVLQRMVFRDVKADRLKWLWQSSQDDGATWKTLWEIDYRRVR